jgi:hypothetical protein
VEGSFPRVVNPNVCIAVFSNLSAWFLPLSPFPKPRGTLVWMSLCLAAPRVQHQTLVRPFFLIMSGHILGRCPVSPGF